MEMIKLRNGFEEPAPLVKMIMMVLNELMSDVSTIMAAVDLVERCRDSSYQFFGNNGAKLHKRGLVDPNGCVHDSIKNIVLSAFEGEGLNLRMVSPVADDGDTGE